jgi:hypothetical protein
MPNLNSIEPYSREACVAAVRGYYHFITKLYLKKSHIIEPPDGGWPDITQDVFGPLEKTDAIVDLLRHLPYIRDDSDGRYQAHGSAHCRWADWFEIGRMLADGTAQPEDVRGATEGLDQTENVPPHVVGLTWPEGRGDIFLIDTQLGIVHWTGCPTEVRDEPSREPIEDDPEDYAPENEMDWRYDSPAWPITDFFELLKDEFRKLRAIPRSPRLVLDTYARHGPEAEEVFGALRGIYHSHNWPDLERYRKDECLEAVQTVLEERYPRWADRRDDEGDVEQGEENMKISGDPAEAGSPTAA